ncbi:YczE/YyaS/YitT family protein [Kribbibacterium absianum]|uniref:YczE/YyaS/YitT family protein n=1 Tax=Kribbibacterium absianum TaxID=3044210 RepID=UPI0024BC5877|nr:DUF6198 family protein [Olsenella sp. YH-ols2216]MDJ1122402.1 DUF6198 family protein [Olsenella sp. YH-ols2216]
MACSLLLMGLGVSLQIKASLGTSPISSIPYVTAQISGLTVGTTTIIVNAFFVLAQFAILRREVSWTTLLQLLMAAGMGGAIDLWNALLPFDTPDSYVAQWLLCAAGIVTLALGVSLEIRSDLTVAAGEGIVQAVAHKTGAVFGNVKVAFDVSCVVVALVCAVVCLGAPAGVREGTVAAALCVGVCTKGFSKVIRRLDERRWARRPARA